MRNDIHNYLKNYEKEELILLNKSELARRFNCDRRTVDRYMNIESGKLATKPSDRIYKSVLDEFKPVIINKVDVHGCTAMAVFKFIQRKGYVGQYSTVASFVSKHKNEEKQKATIRFETTPGLQAQVDWKENLTLVSKYGEIFKVNIFLMVLGYSRMKFIKLTATRSQQELFQCMISAHEYFGGISHEVLFDNMKTVVDHSKTTFRKVSFNKTFEHFAADAGFKPIACQPYRPQTKGKVEALAKLTSRLLVYNEEFEDFEELENIVNDVRDELNLEVSQATQERPIDRLAKEKEYLKPITNQALLQTYVSVEKAYNVTNESMIKYKGKKYSVPIKYIDKKVNVTETEDGNIHIYYNQDLIACHPISEKIYHYTKTHMHEILASDACKNMDSSAIDEFILENMSLMDIYLGE